MNRKIALYGMIILLALSLAGCAVYGGGYGYYEHPRGYGYYGDDHRGHPYGYDYRDRDHRDRDDYRR